MANISYLERSVFGMSEVDALLGLSTGTSRRWIDGYERDARHYEPVVREKTTGADLVTWGEFVETWLLAQYRDARVPMLRMRPVVEGLRQRLQVRYPLATVRPYVDEELRVVYEVQQETELEESMRIVVEAGTGRYVLAPPARSFKHTVEFEDVDNLSVVARIRPLGLKREVVIDPNRRSGAPVVRAVPTDVLAELIRAGEQVEWVAKQYDLSLDQVLDAWEYERAQAA